MIHDAGTLFSLGAIDTVPMVLPAGLLQQFNNSTTYNDTIYKYIII